MKDSDIEDLLRKYRPTGPPVDMRQRIFATARVSLIWPWATAAAALLVVGLTFQLAARHAMAGARVNLGPSATARVTEDLTTRLGGDLRARELAELIVVEQQVQSEIGSAAIEPATGTGGVPR